MKKVLLTLASKIIVHYLKTDKKYRAGWTSAITSSVFDAYGNSKDTKIQIANKTAKLFLKDLMRDFK